MKTIVLVGAEGYLGQHVRAELKEAGHKVFSMDALLWEGQVAEEGTWVGDAGSVEGISVVRDVKPACIVWLGAVAHDPRGNTPAAFVSRHTYAAPSQALCELSEIPAVFVSSMSVFDSQIAKSHYGVAKLAVEHDLQDYRSVANTAVLRFGTLFGEGYTAESFREHLLLNSMVLSAIREHKIYVRNPNARRPVKDVQEAAHDVLWAAKGLLDESTFEGGTVKNHYSGMRTIRDFGYGVAFELGECEVVCEEGADVRDYAFKFNWQTGTRWPYVGDLKKWILSNEAEITAKKYKGAS